MDKYSISMTLLDSYSHHQNGHLGMNVKQVHSESGESPTTPVVQSKLVPHHPKVRHRAHHQGKLTPTLGSQAKYLRG